MPGARRGQKREQDALKLEIKMVVTYHVASGNETQVLYKNKFSELSSLVSSPLPWDCYLSKGQIAICSTVPAIHLDFDSRTIENM